VVLVSRSPLAASASYWAQGGVAAALAAEDSPESHAEDTMAAGRGLCRPSAVQALCQDAPARVQELIDLGVRFDADRTGALALGLEGGHSHRRVAHAGGAATGRRITRQLSALAAAHPLITILEGASADALWIQDGRCIGLRAAPARAASPPCPAGIVASATILATGGAAALWKRTTNPRGAIGAGMSLARHAGARLADLELLQFHPTALVADDENDGFLITEAVRGEGALLLDADGERFVDELAPRDVVALAVKHQLEKGGGRSVGLDLRPVDMSRFPNIQAALVRAGLDPSAAPVPVAPAAHYMMGGIATDLDGRSSIPGLFAVGECACTGLHGANRIASNSLAECVVFSHRAVQVLGSEPAPPASPGPPPEPAPSPVPPAETREALSLLAGLERTPEDLEALSGDPFPLARLIALSALARKESRGAHQRADFPEEDPALAGMHTVIDGNAGPALEHWD
jgi:L-aspartate oxidase